MASGQDTQVTAAASGNALPKREMDLERKRARDRKSQQAMRDRNKWHIHSLSEQVSALTKSLEEHSIHAQQLSHRLQQLELENDHLRVQNAALRLSLLGDTNRKDSLGQDGVSVRVPVWKLPPNNTPASNLSDTILQDVVTKRRSIRLSQPQSNAPSPATPESLNASNYPSKPNLCALLDKDIRADDDISNIVSDIIRSYKEIAALPNQVAQAYSMTTLLRWQVLLDEVSWNMIPEWLKPTQAQLTIPHAAWIDRMPWPKMRDYLIEHPEITLDELAVVYSSSFYIRWPYDHTHVLIRVDDQAKTAITNPIFEEHIRDLKNWAVDEPFCQRFPELGKLVNEDIDDT